MARERFAAIDINAVTPVFRVRSFSGKTGCSVTFPDYYDGTTGTSAIIISFTLSRWGGKYARNVPNNDAVVDDNRCPNRVAAKLRTFSLLITHGVAEIVPVRILSRRPSAYTINFKRKTVGRNGIVTSYDDRSIFLLVRPISEIQNRRTLFRSHFVFFF